MVCLTGLIILYIYSTDTKKPDDSADLEDTSTDYFNDSVSSRDTVSKIFAEISVDDDIKNAGCFISSNQGYQLHKLSSMYPNKELIEKFYFHHKNINFEQYYQEDFSAILQIFLEEVIL